MTYLLGFDIGGTKCAAILGRKKQTDEPPEIVEKAVFATADFRKPQSCIAHFTAEIRRIMTAHGVSNGDVKALGISCGGPLDSKRGVILSPPNLPGWDDVRIVEILSREFPFPVLLQNDANACAVAEWKFGAGRGTRNMIFLTFGTGLGAGLILDGKLYSGTNDMAGECGHVRLEPAGPVGYGKIGSFEGFCSGGGIAQLAVMHAQRAHSQGRDVAWYAPEKGIIPTAKSVAEAANNGDKTAIEVYQDCARHLGYGLSILIDILNPERIVIGSVFTRSEKLLRDDMQNIIEREALPLSAEVCRVVPAQLNENIGDFASLALADSL